MIRWLKEVLSNIYLAAKVCNFKRSDGSKKSISLDSREFNNFADVVKDLIEGHCSIVYTDFACHVGPIVERLRFSEHRLLWQNERIRKERIILQMEAKLLLPHVHLGWE